MHCNRKIWHFGKNLIKFSVFFSLSPVLNSSYVCVVTSKIEIELWHQMCALLLIEHLFSIECCVSWAHMHMGIIVIAMCLLFLFASISSISLAVTVHVYGPCCLCVRVFFWLLLIHLYTLWVTMISSLFSAALSLRRSDHQSTIYTYINKPFSVVLASLS